MPAYEPCEVPISVSAGEVSTWIRCHLRRDRDDGAHDALREQQERLFAAAQVE